MVGTATETFIRIIHDFKEEQLTSTNGRKINIQELMTLDRIGGIYQPQIPVSHQVILVNIVL